MITAETIKRAKHNIDMRNSNPNNFHFISFALGLAVGLIFSAIIFIFILV